MTAPNTSTDPKVVIRCGHIIPQIRLTPPDSRPLKAPSVPDQDLSANSLYVPLRTEEVGWEEGGLIWAPKRYCYPTVNLYGGADDHVIGQYRGGPKGYRFIKITDPAFALANDDEDEVKVSSSSSTAKSSKSQMPRGPVATKETATPTEEVEEDALYASFASSTSASSHDGRRSSSASSYASSSSSSSSSRQGSFSTDDDGHSSGADTGMTTPTGSESPVSYEKESMANKLEAALAALEKTEPQQEEGHASLPSANSSPFAPTKRKLARRTGAGEIPSDPVDASRLGGPLKAELYNNAIGHDRTIALSSSVPEEHFTQRRGRSTAKMALLDYITDDAAGEYAGGWAYEQNIEMEHVVSRSKLDSGGESESGRDAAAR